MMHRSSSSLALAYPMLSGESIMSESQERSAALRELIDLWRARANHRHNKRCDDCLVECADELEALIEREAAASLSPQPAPATGHVCGLQGYQRGVTPDPICPACENPAGIIEIDED